MRTSPPTFKPASKDDPIFKEGPSLVAVRRQRPDPVPIDEHAVLRLAPDILPTADLEAALERHRQRKKKAKE